MVMMTVPSVAGMVMMMRGRIRRHMRHVVVVNTMFLMMSRASRRAQHRCRHRAPDGEQHCKQYQEPDTSGFHLMSD